MKIPSKSKFRTTAETARRITGISVPFGGIQWSDPGPSDRERVRGFLLELEDRRVLYNPDWLEVRDQVDMSINEIRKACTQTLKGLSPTDFATSPVRNIRAAGRRYLDDALIKFRFFDFHRDNHGMSAGAFLALGTFRATVGQEVARLSGFYNIDLEGDLASVMPNVDGED